MSRLTAERLEMLRAQRGAITEEIAHELWAEIDALRLDRDEWQRQQQIDSQVRQALEARVRELEDVERTLNESCAWYHERVQRLEMALASIRIGKLESVNIRNGVAFSYCPECGTEQGPPITGDA